MEGGAITKWLKSKGDLVAKGEILFELETDKAVVEVESPASGTLLRIGVSDGPVRVEQIVAWIGQSGELLDDVETGRVTSGPSLPVDEASPQPLATPRGGQTGILATPSARRRARELNLELGRISGTGPGGRILLEDVERTFQPSDMRSNAREGPPRIPGRNQLIQQLTSSWQNVPHIHIARQMDAERLVTTKRKITKSLLPHPSYTDLVLYVLSRLLVQYPRLTMTWDGGNLESPSALHLSFAVHTSNGVVAPVIQNANSLTLSQLCLVRRVLTEAARSRHLKISHLQGGIFTLTNLGMEGVDYFLPIINSPQTAILSIGRISQQPVVDNGNLRAGWRMWATLALDHRVADGMLAARFLAQLQTEFDRLSDTLNQSP